MNLMKYFNKDYAYQNIKKSRSVLAFFLGFIPAFTVIMFLILFYGKRSLTSLTLESLSLVQTIGLYIIPIILSGCLFGFVYKRKSVDFIGSMPLSRKTLFITNTITGILLIILLTVLNGFLIYITSCFIGVIIPFRMIADFILIWSINYIFVFILSNLAMSVSGNMITQVIVTVLLLFLVPFIHDYTTNMIRLANENGSNQPTVVIKDDGVDFSTDYNYVDTDTYTLPYGVIHMSFYGNYHIYSISNVVKTVFISVIGFIGGLYLFKKRKMEDNEITFKKLYIHNIIKALTMIPIVSIVSLYLVSSGGYASGILILVILFAFLIYYFVYDLITKKSISKVGTNLIHFCITIVCLFSSCLIVNQIVPKVRECKLSLSDIEAIDINDGSYSFDNLDYLHATNKDTIKELIQAFSMADESYSFGTGVRLQTKKGDIVFPLVFSDREAIDEVLAKDETVINGKQDDNFDKAFAITYDNINRLYASNNSYLIDEVERVVKENPTCRSGHFVYYYIYEKGRLTYNFVDVCGSSKLTSFAQDSIRDNNSKILKEGLDITNFQLVSISGLDEDTSDTFNNLLYQYYFYILDEVDNLKEAEFNINEEYVELYLSKNNKNYSYYTNQVDEVKRIINEASVKFQEEEK